MTIITQSSERPENLDTIKKALLERKKELEEKLTLLYTEKVTDDQVQDPGDQAVSSSMESLRLSLQDTERDEYNRIVKALAKIEDGTYGMCVDCEQAISDKRLKLNPNATRCLACQEIFEENQS